MPEDVKTQSVILSNSQRQSEVQEIHLFSTDENLLFGYI